jgi:DNA-binding transcriptional MerR regulator
MKITEVKNNKNQYLYEGLTPKYQKTMMLWESVGRTIAEAQMSPEDIKKLFQQVEKDQTAAGGNRTAAGQAKDVAGAVANAYKDLRSKVENSATMQMFDQKYEDAAKKLKTATGGDQGVMQYVEKYRTFAKKYPMAQSLIYGALIAAAGISGAGAGGAAALGLLKMADKLLQGEKFSKASIAGAETGALAYGAGKVGDMMRSDDTTTTSSQIDQTSSGMQATWPTQGVVPPGMLERFPPGQFQYMQSGDYWEVLDAAGNKMANFTVDSMNESIQLTNAQVISLLESIAIQEGLWDQFKQKAAGVVGSPEERAEVSQQIKQGVGAVTGAVAQKAQTIGKNITTKITADKLNKAWTAAGSPTDSDAIAKFLTAQGVNPDVVDSAMSTVGVSSTAADTAQAVDTSKLPDVSALTPEQKQALLAKLDQLDQAKAGTAPAAVTKPTIGAGGKRGTMAESKKYKKMLAQARARLA